MKHFLPLALLLAGCHSTPATPAAQRAQLQQETDSARQQLDLIPPPSKNRYMAVSTLAAWQNPYITVYPGMLTLHVLMPDMNPSTIGVGGITRPIGARRRDLSIDPDKLADALSAIPANAWPYGRVVGMEEAHNIPSKDGVQTRRTMEGTMQQLTNLGVVMYDWNENGTRALTE